MKHLKTAATILIITIFTACSGGGKKVMIMASGKLVVDEKDQKTIKLDPGTTHNEKEITLSGSGKETLTVQSPQGNKTFDVDGEGHYLLNLKADTLVGGLVRYGAGNGSSASLSMEQVQNMIDSTQQLIAGQNVSDEKKTYFITPFSIKKVSTNVDSRIIGPYNGIPGSVSADNTGKTPEMYKLFTTKQKREALDALIKQVKK